MGQVLQNSEIQEASCSLIEACGTAEARRVDESLVHLVSELPQLLAQQGWDLGEAAERVQQLQLDVQEILGELPNQHCTC